MSAAPPNPAYSTTPTSKKFCETLDEHMFDVSI
jgi:hypothetical protein